jgi:hypothetical protein
LSQIKQCKHPAAAGFFHATLLPRAGETSFRNFSQIPGATYAQK